MSIATKEHPKGSIEKFRCFQTGIIISLGQLAISKYVKGFKVAMSGKGVGKVRKLSASRGKMHKIDPIELEVKKEKEDYVLTWQNNILLTADGKTQIRHSASTLLEHMASEFNGQGQIEIQDRVIVGPKFFGA